MPIIPLGVSEDVIARAEHLKQSLASRQPIYPLASPIARALQDPKVYFIYFY
jgi:hypothetical protein